MRMRALYDLVVSSLFAMLRTVVAVGVAVYVSGGLYLHALGTFVLYVFLTGLLELSLSPYLMREIRRKEGHDGSE